jgi:tetratricopeptide (TPR) repeat protein
MDAAGRESHTDRWADAMRDYIEFLRQEQNQKTDIAATLTLLELPNLFALLERAHRATDVEATIDLATAIYSLLQGFGKPRLLQRVAQARDTAAAALSQTWNHARFLAQGTRIEQQLRDGRLREAFAGAQELLRRAREAGEAAYPNADYDLAMSCSLLGQVLSRSGAPEQALPILNEAVERFESITDIAAKGMAAACHGNRGNCLRDLGRLDEAAAAYEEGIRGAKEHGGERGIAVKEAQLGTVRLLQHRYDEALRTYEEARERFTRLDEPGSLAVIWHQIGLACHGAGQPESAEDAYRKSLALKVRLGDVSGQAGTLVQLGSLYADAFNRPEEAVAFERQAVDIYVNLSDAAGEGRTRVNLGKTLLTLRRFTEARQEIRWAIESKARFGHASEPWKTWDILHDIEAADGNPVAAAEAKRKAVERYLAYRRDGGENHNSDGRACLAITQALLADEPAAAASLLEQLSADTDLPAWLRPFVQALQAIVNGSRDRTLADDPDLDYTSSAEILFLLETLDRTRP